MLPIRLGFSASFFLLFFLSLVIFGTTIATARTSQDAAIDERGDYVRDKNGNCVRTKWMGEEDPCAPPAPPPPPKKIVKPAPPPKPIIKLEQRTIYFDFDSAELDSEAVNKLGVLARIINQSKAIADVHIVGYADEIGSSSYNQKLSERRVTSVKEYLDRRTRFDTKVADIRALGELKSDKCKGLPRKKRIECLRPNRKVEIEFKYRVR